MCVKYPILNKKYISVISIFTNVKTIIFLKLNINDIFLKTKQNLSKKSLNYEKML